MYQVEFFGTADKQFAKLDVFTQKMIAKYINKNLDGTGNPRRFGRALKRSLRGLWRYHARSGKLPDQP